MAFIDFNFFSEALGMQTQAYIILPQESVTGQIGINTKKSENKRKYKCLYLLHGLSDDHTIWLRRTSIERYASKYGICVVMPCADKSFYCDMKYGNKYYTYIAKELPKIICEFFNVSDKRDDNFVAGLSMGGYGALKIALRECDSFCAGAGLSSVADIRNRVFDSALVPVFGGHDQIPNEDDLFFLADKLQPQYRPKLFMGVGKQDFLYDSNIRLKKHLEKLNYNLTYKESDGTHCWEFWDEYIQYILEWMFG